MRPAISIRVDMPSTSGARCKISESFREKTQMDYSG